MLCPEARTSSIYSGQISEGLCLPLPGSRPLRMAGMGGRRLRAVALLPGPRFLRYRDRRTSSTFSSWERTGKYGPPHGSPILRAGMGGGPWCKWVFLKRIDLKLHHTYKADMPTDDGIYLNKSRSLSGINGIKPKSCISFSRSRDTHHPNPGRSAMAEGPRSISQKSLCHP